MGYQSAVFELHIESDGGVRRTGLYARIDGGQLSLLESWEWGPFDTSLEISQWAWRGVARALAAH